MKDIRTLIMRIMTSTVAVAILLTLVAWMLWGPEKIPPEGRERMAALITLLIGILSGDLLGKRNGAPPHE
jgi:hypothetical protein